MIRQGTDRAAQSRQPNRPTTFIEPVTIEHRSRSVRARRLTVSRELPLPAAQVFREVQRPALLQFVARGFLTIRPANGSFPDRWQEGHTYATRLRLFGWIPFGGVHYLHIEQIDSAAYRIITREWDRHAKVWNHTIRVHVLDETHCRYEDSIVIYGGVLTGLITRFAALFYRHRQRRWGLVADE